MKRVLFSILFCLALNFNVNAQNETFLSYIQTGFSPTYIWSNGNFPEPFNYSEFTLNFNISTPINKRFSIGAQILPVWGSYSANEITKNNYMLYGIFSQFNLLNVSQRFGKIRNRKILIELSANTGDYCLCKASKNSFVEYYSEPNIFYLGLGASYEILTVGEKLGFEFGFYAYNNLSVKNSVGFTQYVIGINYRINNLRKSKAEPGAE